MSRSGYSEDCDGWSLIRWRGAVSQAMYGKRGQKLMRDLLAALDSMTDKRLIADDLVTATGEFCALGVLGHCRGIDMANLNPEDTHKVGQAFDIAPALAAEIVYMNDEAGSWYDEEDPEKRWTRMRAWVEAKIKAA